jgi:hypothetical protein
MWIQLIVSKSCFGCERNKQKASMQATKIKDYQLIS